MITDEERRVVASSLRESANVGGARTLKRELVKALGIRLDACTSEGSHTNILRGLADLIDRPTCRNVSGYKDVFMCSECRCKVEIVREECNEYGEFYTPFMPSFCPSCGAEVER